MHAVSFKNYFTSINHIEDYFDSFYFSKLNFQSKEREADAIKNIKKKEILYPGRQDSNSGAFDIKFDTGFFFITTFNYVMADRFTIIGRKKQRMAWK